VELATQRYQRIFGSAMKAGGLAQQKSARGSVRPQ